MPVSILHCIWCLVTGAVNHSCHVDPTDIMYVEQFISPPSPPASLEFLDLVELVMEEHGLYVPHSVGEAVIFYVSLIDALEDVFESLYI